MWIVAFGYLEQQERYFDDYCWPKDRAQYLGQPLIRWSHIWVAWEGLVQGIRHLDVLVCLAASQLVLEYYTVCISLKLLLQRMKLVDVEASLMVQAKITFTKISIQAEDFTVEARK